MSTTDTSSTWGRQASCRTLERDESRAERRRLAIKHNYMVRLPGAWIDALEALAESSGESGAAWLRWWAYRGFRAEGINVPAERDWRGRGRDAGAWRDTRPNHKRRRRRQSAVSWTFTSDGAVHLGDVELGYITAGGQFVQTSQKRSREVIEDMISEAWDAELVDGQPWQAFIEAYDREREE